MKFLNIAMLLILIIAIGAFAYLLPPSQDIVQPETGQIKRFSSEQEFKSYLTESSESSGYLSGGVFSAATKTMAEQAAAPSIEGAGLDVSSRVSTTNVQVAGIDEPDIVKTDEKEIYFSSYGYRDWWGPAILESQIMPPYYSGGIKLINAFPPEDLKIDDEIEKTGDLLLHEKILVVFSGNEIYGYDVSDPKSPEEEWKIELNGSIVGARLYGDKIYLITGNYIDYYHPCPIVPLTKDGVSIEIGCPMIYHPIDYIPADIIYNAIVLNPNSGSIERTASFVGSSGSSLIYMSENAIYLTYTYNEDYSKMIYDFFKERGADLVPSYVLNQIEKLSSYDISTQSKVNEIMIIIQRYESSLSSDDRMKFENELQNRMQDYSEEHNRDLMKTGIVKMSLSLEVLGVGSAPGSLLNQFSLDEYQGNLRVATTIGEWSGKSANDVYVLDGNLKIIGSVLDLGLGERIYSVRFLQDKGYVVTFKQVDPFFVLDLSNPANPELKGELKIPGYSSYLHPITKDKILGIGKEDQNVKISLFDVSSAENPQEVDHYSLSEYWSEILNTHHAFLLDDKHEVFFLPGSIGGYVFSYENNNLELKKAVSDISAKRAVYIDDYLYIIGEDKIVVLDENNWSTVKDLDLI
ncbi:MAG TPA: beta-propeller domain-containing protein [archaeon]|nr:beta-propeller domain-containing protein [archaeon]